jgi:hypothetical protein
MDELIQEWKLDDAEVPSSVVGSPLDLLLGRVDESEDEYGSLQSMEQDKDPGQFRASRWLHCLRRWISRTRRIRHIGTI